VLSDFPRKWDGLGPTALPVCWRPTRQSHNSVPKQPSERDLRYGPPVDLGYARVSTAKQDMDRQVDALHQAGIAPELSYLHKKSGVTIDRPGLEVALAYARRGDVIVVHPPWTGSAAPSGTPSTSSTSSPSGQSRSATSLTRSWSTR